MQNSFKPSTGQQDNLDNNYQIIKHSQDMSTVIRQAITARSSHFSQYALVIIVLHFTATKASSRVRSMTPEHSTHSILNAICRRVRYSDLIWLQDTTCYFLLPEANLRGGNIVQNRLWDALQEHILSLNENVGILPSAMTIGYSAYPEPSHTLEECIYDAQLVQMHFEQSQPDDAEQAHSQPKPDLSIMARQFGVPYLPFLPRTFSNKVKRLVKPELAQELHCFPLGCTNNTLTVAMSNPQDSQVLDRLQSETGMHIFPVLIHPDELENALEHINT